MSAQIRTSPTGDLPIFCYSEVKDHHIGKGSIECAVCLDKFEDDETLRLLPPCDHVFHPECINAWLGSHVTCPVCRTNLSPMAESPPGSDLSVASEVVVQVDEDNDRSESPLAPAPPPPAVGRSWSIRMPVFRGSVKFRSHSTGYSMVYQGENLGLFTLRLLVQVQMEVMDRASLNRVVRDVRSLDRWGFSTRTMSMRSLKAAAVEGGGGEGGSGDGG